MIKKNSIAIIPARGGSKRIPGKNFKNFLKKPIIAYTIKSLQKSKLFDKIVVSTDSPQIAKVSKKYGAEVPFLRPKKLSGDSIDERPAIQHCLTYYEKKGLKFTRVCTVYPANPFLEISDLKKGLSLLKKKKNGYVFSATEYLFPYLRSFVKNKKKIKPLFKKNILSRSQDLKQKILADAGSFYWGNTTNWLSKSEKTAITPNSDIILIPNWRYHDIDTHEDWKRAELFYKALKLNKK